MNDIPCKGKYWTYGSCDIKEEAGYICSGCGISQCKICHGCNTVDGSQYECGSDELKRRAKKLKGKRLR